MTHVDCDQVRERLEAYTLGVLDSAERAAVERHLAGCADCQSLAKAYAEAGAALPQALAAASPFAPPAALKDRLLQSLDASPAASARVAGPAPRTRDRLSLRRWPAWSRTGFLRAAAVLVLLALFLAWNAQLQVALARERDLRLEIADLMSEQQALVFELLDSSQAVRVVLRPSDPGSTAYGKFFTRPDLPETVAMANRLSPPPPGQAYHLWLTRQGETQLAGVMPINRNGFGLLIYRADRDGPVYDSIQLTLQPIGSTTPAGTPVLSWEASR